MALSQEQKVEIESLRADGCETLRTTVPELESILYKPLPVLDHGFVRVIDYMGDDSAIVQAARVSYGKGTKQISKDQGLINYLMRHWHTTPFEMCEIKFHIKLPIFVARQWIRHRTANVNEYSGRYSVMDREFYIPQAEHLAVQSTQNHQGRGEVLQGAQAQEVLDILKRNARDTYHDYQVLLNEDDEGLPLDEGRQGSAREWARMALPVNMYTQWYWKIDLHNLMHFLRLRADPHAQYEIRVYAEVMCDVLRRWLPLTYKAFEDYRLGGINISAKGLEIVKRMLKGEQVTQETSGLSAREYTELMKTLEL